MSGPPDEKQKARVLIVEDEPLVAESLRSDLEDAGFEVVGVANRLEGALKSIENAGFEIAVVDANLAGTSAGPAAAALSARGVPFLVMSGYAREQLQREFTAAVYIQKPYRITQVIDHLTVLLRDRRK